MADRMDGMGPGCIYLRAAHHAGRSARLRAHHIMYDEDAGGQFMQFYSTALPGGFFLEIVQRRGNYAGYGAPNAPLS